MGVPTCQSCRGGWTGGFQGFQAGDLGERGFAPLCKSGHKHLLPPASGEPGLCVAPLLVDTPPRPRLHYVHVHAQGPSAGGKGEPRLVHGDVLLYCTCARSRPELWVQRWASPSMRVYCCTAHGCSAILLVGKEPAMQSHTYPPYTVTHLSPLPPRHRSVSTCRSVCCSAGMARRWTSKRKSTA